MRRSIRGPECTREALLLTASFRSNFFSASFFRLLAFCNATTRKRRHSAISALCECRAVEAPKIRWLERKPTLLLAPDRAVVGLSKNFKLVHAFISTRNSLQVMQPNGATKAKFNCMWEPLLQPSRLTSPRLHSPP